MRNKRRRKMRERKRAERFAKTLFNFAFANLSEKFIRFNREEKKCS